MDLILCAHIDIKLFAMNVNNRCNNTERGFNLPFADLILHAYIDIKLFVINVNNRHNNTERDFNLPFMDGSDFARIH